MCAPRHLSLCPLAVCSNMCKSCISTCLNAYFQNEAAHSIIVLIQGPCIGNQESLAHSRLWDAVVGFLHVFAHMQMKLSQVDHVNVLISLQNHQYVKCIAQ